jgi:phage/plasmid primase-like uncharacterized protein
LGASVNTFDRDLIERARQADILAVAQRHGAKLRRVGGGEFVGPCPVCGGTDRFSVNTRNAFGIVEGAV